ncbi:MAG: 4Fe-4S binding protein [Lachnospiraceae bacterium]|nr:4Fe-4S binding protein [Lachnospiraceae bacterium]
MFAMHRNRLKKNGRIRSLIQLGFAAFLNGYARGFWKGQIFTGQTKGVCVPVLNCYSCPGALGACPVGAMQAALGDKKKPFPFYVLGTLMLFGVLFGRLLCGFVCPFGFLQDILHKIPVPKIRLPQRVDRILRGMKYVLLLLFVVLLPLMAVDRYGISTPWFCKYICPAGTLEGGVFLAIPDSRLRGLLGALFTWKFGVLLFVIVGAMTIPRFFCRYFCPLGAFYALFNRFSFYQMTYNHEKCVDCGKCESVCPMEVNPIKELDGFECIRCGKCKDICPSGAIENGIMFTKEGKDKIFDK